MLRKYITAPVVFRQAVADAIPSTAKTAVMMIWCENCQSNNMALAGKGNYNLCQQCGCEVSSTGQHLVVLQTQLALESQLDLQGDQRRDTNLGDADFGDTGMASSQVYAPGELAGAESILGEVKQQFLSTAKYLPAEFYAEEALIAGELSELDEAWPDDQLLEKLQRLENSLHLPTPAQNAASQQRSAERPVVELSTAAYLTDSLRESLRQASAGSDDTNGAGLAGNGAGLAGQKAGVQFRVDLGHVMSQQDIDARKAAQVAAGQRSPGSSSANPSGQKYNASHPPIAAPAGNFSDSNKQLPIAKRLHPIAGNSVPGTRIDVPANQVSDFANRSVGPSENTNLNVTCLGLVTMWCVQTLIATTFLQNAPSSLWWLWMTAEIGGTMCLGFVLYYLLNAAPAITPPRTKNIKPPIKQVLANRENAKSTR